MTADGHMTLHEIRQLIVQACKEAWDTPGDEWGPIQGVFKTDDQIANEIADRLMGETHALPTRPTPGPQG